MPSRLQRALNRTLATAARTKAVRLALKRPIVSFTFDDAPLSAATIGADILEAAGAHGTYYVAGQLCGELEEGRPILGVEDLVKLCGSGHELACHTYSHTPISTLTRQQMAEEARRNQAFIKEVCGDVHLTSFSYPFGDVSLARKLQAQSLFASARGIQPGVNSGLIDLGLLKAVAIYSASMPEERASAFLDLAERTTGWLIFYTHDVEKTPSPWGATPDHLRTIVQAAVGRGFEVLPVRNALGRIAGARYS